MNSDFKNIIQGYWPTQQKDYFAFKRFLTKLNPNPDEWDFLNKKLGVVEEIYSLYDLYILLKILNDSKITTTSEQFFLSLFLLTLEELNDLKSNDKIYFFNQIFNLCSNQLVKKIYPLVQNEQDFLFFLHIVYMFTLWQTPLKIAKIPSTHMKYHYYCWKNFSFNFPIQKENSLINWFLLYEKFTRYFKTREFDIDFSNQIDDENPIQIQIELDFFNFKSQISSQIFNSGKIFYINLNNILDPFKNNFTNNEVLSLIFLTEKIKEFFEDKTSEELKIYNEQMSSHMLQEKIDPGKLLKGFQTILRLISIWDIEKNQFLETQSSADLINFIFDNK